MNSDENSKPQTDDVTNKLPTAEQMFAYVGELQSRYEQSQHLLGMLQLVVVSQLAAAGRVRLTKTEVDALGAERWRIDFKQGEGLDGRPDGSMIVEVVRARPEAMGAAMGPEQAAGEIPTQRFGERVLRTAGAAAQIAASPLTRK